MLAILLVGVLSASQPAFPGKVAVFDAKTAAMQRAEGTEAQGTATLEWLRALKAVLDAVPFDGTTAAQRAWLESKEDLVVYHEPAGQWIIQDAAIWRAYERVRSSAAADDIAWLAVENGLPGECEGYVPCYLYRLDRTSGEYLRRHPRGRHRGEALAKVAEMLEIILDDLLKRPDAKDFMKVPDDCKEVRQSASALRAAASRVAHANTAKVVAGLDRLTARCQVSTSR